MASKLKLASAARTETHMVPTEGKVKKETYYEKIEVDLEDIPALAGKNPGDFCLLITRARMVSKGLREYGDDKGKPYARVEIREIAGVPASYKATDKKKDPGMNSVLAALEGYTE